MRNLAALLSCAAALVSSIVESTSISRTPEGGLEIEIDLKDLSDLPRKLQEVPERRATTTSSIARDALLDERSFQYEDGSDASLLNQLIGFFLPHVNSLLQDLIPDPLPAPVHGRVQIPEIDLFGYCKARAGFDVNFGTLRGLSGVSIDRLRVVAGTEKITPGWSVTNGCFETFWSAFFDVAVSGLNALTVDDMSAGISASACSYSINEEISGGITTMAPRFRGALNISGVLLGTLATIDVAEIVHSFEVGYDTIQGYVNDAPPAINQAIRNITGELSMLAKDELVTFFMDDQLSNTAAPSLNARMMHGMENSEVTLSYGEAFQLGSGFVSNGAERTISTLAEDASQFFGNMGFHLGATEHEEEEGEGKSEPNEDGDEGIVGGPIDAGAEEEGEQDVYDALSEEVVDSAGKFLEGAANFLGSIGFEARESNAETQSGDEGIAGGIGGGDEEEFGILSEEVIADAAGVFVDAQKQVIESAASFLGVDIGGANAPGDEGIAGGIDDGSNTDGVITEETIQELSEAAAETATEIFEAAQQEALEGAEKFLDGVGNFLGEIGFQAEEGDADEENPDEPDNLIGPTDGEDGEEDEDEEQEYGIVPKVWESATHWLAGLGINV